MKTCLPFMVFLLFHRHFKAALCLFTLCLSALCLTGPLVAAPVAPQKLSVGLYASAPFVELDDGGRPYGMAIDIWREVEDRLDIRSVYTIYPTIDALVHAAEEGSIDVALTNLTVTYERARDLSFSYPWYDAGLRIMIHSNHHTSVWDELRRTGKFQTYFWLGLIMVVLSLTVTLIRRRLDNSFTQKWHEGLAINLNDLLIAARGGTLRPTYLGWLGYLLSSLWMLCGVALVAYVTSTITSAMTTASLSYGISSFTDLPGKRIGVRSGSSAEALLKRHHLRSVSFPNVPEAAEALQARKIDALIADAPVLEYWTYTHPQTAFHVVGTIFHAEKYAFAAPKRNAALMEAVSLEIMRMHDLERLNELKKHYFGLQR